MSKIQFLPTRDIYCLLCCSVTTTVTGLKHKTLEESVGASGSVRNEGVLEGNFLGKVMLNLSVLDEEEKDKSGEEAISVRETNM